MKADYFTFYLEASIVCILIFLILLINNRKYGTRTERQIWYDRTIVVHILYFTSDIGWAAILGGVLPRIRFLAILFNLTNYLLLGLIAYIWFMYMATCEEMNFRKVPRKIMLVTLPMWVSLTALIAVFAVSPDSLINSEAEPTVLYFIMMVSAPHFYLLSAVVFSMINARKADTPEERRQYRMLGFYPLSVAFFGLIQTFLLNAPMFCFGCTIMMLHFYIHNLQIRISVDALTELNNRGRVDRYMAQVRYRKQEPMYAVMLDINRFKQINDTFGHAEGDRALILVADTLRETAEEIRRPIFLGRYGGDEYCIFIQTDEEGVRELARIIREKLARRQKDSALLYELTVSMGYDLLRDEKDTMAACLARADEKLYAEKRKIGALR